VTTVNDPTATVTADVRPDPTVTDRRIVSGGESIGTPYSVYHFPPGVPLREFFRRVMRSMKTTVETA